MNVPSPREPSHGDSRWATVRYALSSNARTARLCLILLVMTGVPGVLLAVVLHHVRLRRVLMPTHGDIRCRLRRHTPAAGGLPHSPARPDRSVIDTTRQTARRLGDHD
jgi:hypothetical protein